MWLREFTITGCHKVRVESAELRINVSPISHESCDKVRVRLITCLFISGYGGREASELRKDRERPSARPYARGYTPFG